MNRIPYLVSACFVVLACRETPSAQRDLHLQPIENEEGGASSEENIVGGETSASPPLSSFSRILDRATSLPEQTDAVEEYATDVSLNAGCTIDPATMEFAAKRQEPMLCEHTIAIAARDVDGDYCEVVVPFVWTSSSPLIEIHCLNGTDDNFCWPSSAVDIFDSPDGEEPCGTVTTCAQNTCPADATDCMPEICTSVDVCAIVNIEGAWRFSWQTLPPDTVFFFTQTGRMFEDEWSDLDVGRIEGNHISFEWGDYLFEGTISPDRKTISGTATDQIVMSHSGPWSATLL
jgi:hypothetical protein